MFNLNFIRNLALALAFLIPTGASSLAQESDSGNQAKSTDEQKKRKDIYFQNIAKQYEQLSKAKQNQIYNQYIDDYNQYLRQDSYNKALKNYAELAYAPAQETSKYWIGVQCIPAGRVAILSEIPDVGKLIKEGGLKVNSVTTNSPATKSGLKANDVILSFGGTKTDAVADLTKAIGKTQNRSASLRVVRNGKVITIRLTPQERPKTKKIDPTNIRWDATQNPNWSFEWVPGGGYERVVAWHQATSLPKDVEVVLQRKGEDDPIVIVKRGKDQWTIRNGKVDELPKDVRGYVAKIYKAAKKNVNATYEFYGKNVNFDRNFANYYHPGNSVKSQNPSDKALRDLTRKVEALQKAVEELKRK